MALTSGTRLGPYDVLAQIGAGGMGAVYKARDTRLDRAVAIKVRYNAGNGRGAFSVASNGTIAYARR